ncbi:MAG: hypothetical protein A2946_01415 [Candidatus Liptonbacteria bacterium RIFCSPLOWO2_01_FULL_53_13]|uniref:Glutamate--cysteine ligase n=1 Tax=Candidatus Liptonbacteria bacterium RIFCSPLOWO2_01_FULL_53_13 TaxID=1798651 RepID=A0A1G2CJX4_9BACT|nr:MAG: hypothetical protein A2946_01415 [Candidatus Liptonbacteria bacterium RIFCSPLOWO2_01_FULL_53_13]
MSGFKAFVERFPFQPERSGCIGIERERFLADADGIYAPRAEEFLRIVGDPAWTYELSACQVEDRTDPLRAENDILKNLKRNDLRGCVAARSLGLCIVANEVAPEDMPMDVYPDPRYLKIVEHLKPAALAAACRVTGTHIHVGVGSWERAFAVYHELSRHLEELMALGDHSQGLRLRLYCEVAKSWRPPRYESAEHFFEVATAEGFAGNSRNCWHLVRITKHGTVECRMFGAAECSEEVLAWVSRVRAIVGPG